MNRTVRSSGVYVTCRSLCVFFFQGLREEQINMVCSGIPKVPGDSRKVQSSQEHELFRVDSLEAKHFCSLSMNAASVFRLSLAGVYNKCFYFWWIFSVSLLGHFMNPGSEGGLLSPFLMVLSCLSATVSMLHSTPRLDLPPSLHSSAFGTSSKGRLCHKIQRGRRK